jgi:hypothetical protein
MSAEVKPIVVIYVPDDFSFSEGGMIIKPLDLMKELNGWGDASRRISDSYEGYCWWCFFKQGITEPEFKVFYPKDFTDADYKSLETLIQQALKDKK